MTLALSFIGVMVAILAVASMLTRSEPQPLQGLSQDEQFVKAQFCVQTNRLPLISKTKVICRDQAGRDEEAP